MNPYDFSLNTKYGKGYFQTYGAERGKTPALGGYNWLNYYDTQGNFNLPKIDTNQHITYNPDNFGKSLNQDPYMDLNLNSPTNNTTNSNSSNISKLSGINFAAGVEPTAELIGSMLDRNYKNSMKYAELDNYANQGNVDSFEALDNTYTNLDKAPTASTKDFNGIDGKGWFDNFLKDTTAGVSLGTSIAPGWGTLIGAVAGAANGLIRSGIQAGKSNKAYNDYLLAQERANERLMANLNNSYHNAAMNEYNNLLSNMAAFGGKLNRFDMGGDISNGVNLIDSGSTHELNPYEGVQQGVDSQGIPNMVEEGEVVWEDEDYVFSNRLTVPKMPKKKSDDETKEEKFNRLYEGKTFAEVAERLQRESKERPNSGISKDTMNDNLLMLRDLQEEVKMKQQADEFRQEINSMSPEELMGLQQMLGAMGQQGMEQPIPEQMPEQLPQEGMIPQGMPDMGMAVNPAMMGQPMMACGGRLKKFGYGGNLFPDGGNLYGAIMENIPVNSTTYKQWTDNQLNLNELPSKQTYEQQLQFRANKYREAMKQLEGEYVSAMELWNNTLWNNFKNGKATEEEKQKVLNVIDKYYHNCITTTSTIDNNVDKALREDMGKLKKNLKEAGVSENDVDNIASIVGNEKAFKRYASIGGFENSTNYQGMGGNPNFRTIELDYNDKDLEPGHYDEEGNYVSGGKIYEYLKKLPSGVTVGVGYNSNTSTTGDNPAHYIKLNHDAEGNPMFFEGNQSDYMRAVSNASKYLSPEEYEEYVKENPTYDIYNNKGEKVGTGSYEKNYHGARNRDLGLASKYYTFKKKNPDGTTKRIIDYREDENDRYGEHDGRGGRMRIMFPVLEGSNTDVIDSYLTSIDSEKYGVRKVDWQKDEATGDYKPVVSGKDAYHFDSPKAPIRVNTIPNETYDIMPTFEKELLDYDTPYANDILAMAEGGKIYIKPENRGKFTALKERTGHSASWFKENGTPAQKKMATFALNAAKWKHNNGGMLNKFDGGGYYLADSINPYTYYSPYNILGANIGDTSLPIVIDKVPEAPKDNSFLGTEIVTSPIGSYGLDVTHPNYTDYSPKPPKAPKVKKTHPWWNDQWNNFKTAVTNEDWRLHAPEYATALGLAHEYLRDKSKDFAEEVNFARHITEPNISYRPTGTMAPYRPESSLAVLDRLAGMNSASRNAMINLSNASRAAKAMYNAMNDMRYFDALGQMDRQLREQNNTNYLKNLEFNNALAAQNAMGALQAASTNAQLKNAQLASWSHIMDSLNQEALQRDTAKGAMATNLSELVSQHRKEEIQNEMLREMAEKGSLLYYWDPRYQMNYSGNNTSALGGYIDVRPLDKRTKKNRK